MFWRAASAVHRFRRLALGLVLAGLTPLQAVPTAAQPAPALALALQQQLDSVQAAYGVRGVAAAIQLPDGSFWRGAAGVSTVMPFELLRSDMLFGIASLTKTFTAALVLRLAERGFFQLDDPIRQHVPLLASYANIWPGVTIRQLLGHTSGLAEYTNTPHFLDGLAQRPAQAFLPDTLLSYIGPPTDTPGSTFRYINTGYMLLGLLIEAKLGVPLAQAYHQELLTPLGLDSTFLGYQDPIPASMTVAHGWSWATGTLRDLCLAPRTALFSGYQAAGGLLATPADLARWGAMLFGGSVLTPASQQLMQTEDPISGAFHYGLGAIAYRVGVGRTAWGHMGGIIGCHAIFCYEPHCDISIAVVINDDLRPDMRYDLMPRLYAITSQYLCPPQSIPAALLPPSLACLPNPAKGTARVVYRGPATAHALVLTLHDATGQLVQRVELPLTDTRQDVSLIGLPAGVYIARLLADGHLTAPAQRLLVLP